MKIKRINGNGIEKIVSRFHLGNIANISIIEMAKKILPRLCLMWYESNLSIKGIPKGK